MKKIRLLISIVVLCCFTSLFSQEMSSVSAPNAASLMTFDNVPVGLRTGIPDVSIPLYSLPTREKNISVDIGVSYHPYSGLFKGSVGNGWSLPYTACIYREISYPGTSDENQYREIRARDVFYNRPLHNEYQGSQVFRINAPGLSAKFYISFMGNTMSIERNDPSSKDMRIVPFYNSQTFEIYSFAVYDREGNKYIFDKSDSVCYDGFTDNDSVQKTVWCLTKVLNSNGQEILTYTYEDVLGSSQVNVCNIQTKGEPRLISITATGVGIITFEKYPNTTFIGFLKTIKIKQLDGTELKSINFNYTTLLGRVMMRSVSVNSQPNDTSLTYQFNYYQPEEPNTSYVKVDDYGFFYDDRCKRDPDNFLSINPNIRQVGLLESIKYPTGGSTYYEYEPNTYNIEDPDFSYDDLYHNQSSSIFRSQESVEPIFFITEPGYYYIKVLEAYVTGEHANVILDENGNPAPPSFQLISETISGFSPITFSDDHAATNFCDGKKVYLPVGGYRFRGASHPTIKYIMSRRNLNTDIRKWVIGDGVRVKEIKYYDDKIDTDGNPIFEKSVSYTYNNFGDINSTSGYLSTYEEHDIANSRVSKDEPVNYRNVTVKETGKGRIEYTFLIKSDFLEDSSQRTTPFSFWKQNLEKKRQVYDQDGKLIRQIDNEYTFHTSYRYADIYAGEIVENPRRDGIDGYITSLLSKTIDYYYKPNGDHVSKSVTSFSKFNSKIELDYTVDNFGSGGDEIKNQYSYTVNYPNAEVPSFYIRKISEVKLYRGSELLSTKKFQFSQFSGNYQFLPLQTTTKKANNPEQISFVATKYDEFDNLLEGHMQEGITTSLIYGYNKTQVIAEVVNASYEQIAAALNITVSQLSQFNETQIAQLDSLRTSLPQARVTTYTYIPLVGISTMKDPRGKVTSYYYDGLGRLKQVRDNEGRILTENTYNYQPNQQ